MYERLDEVKGKLRERLAEHREPRPSCAARSAASSPTCRVELDLEAARTGRYDRRALAQRFRELEFRSLIDRLPPSTIAPTGHERRRTRRRAGSSCRSICSAAAAARAAGPAAAAEPPARPSRRPAHAGRSRGAIEHVDPRIPAQRGATCVELEAWLAAHGEDVGLGAAAGRGPPLEPRPAGHRLGRPRRESWYLPLGPTADADAWLPRWFARADRPLIGHDLKPLWTMLLRRGIELARAGVRHRGRVVHAQPGAPGPDPSTTWPRSDSGPNCRPGRYQRRAAPRRRSSPAERRPRR